MLDKNVLCIAPLQRDPYEARTVEVRRSQLPGAMDGLFTLRHVTPGKKTLYSSKLHHNHRRFQFNLAPFASFENNLETRKIVKKIVI